MSALTALLEAVPVRRALRALFGLLASGVVLVPLGALADPSIEAPRVRDPRVMQTVSAPDAVAATSVAPEPDGLGEGTAAASCWEIKQRNPASADGVYWLVTPTLGTPQQFYCDQTTAGGGWVLVGRGRENWTQSNEGRLTSVDVAQTPSGPSAFSPAQLPSDTIDGLLDDERVDALADGVRLRRARSIDGGTWQEVRFTYGTPRDDWSWQFAGSQSVRTWSMDSSSGSGGTTGSFGADSSYRRLDTNVDGTRGWARGFSYGSSARGSSSSSSYLWAASSTAGYPRPFTQVFLRPRLMSQNIFSPIPDTGLPASTGVATAQSYPVASPWGVSGLGAAGSGELNTEVADFAESDGVMYVGGNFRYVQRDAAGSGRVEQSYLAAFDVTTGEWLSSFRPTFDNQVKALAVLPDGRIAVGGAFSTANGQSSPSFAVIDPTTGASDPAVTTRVINYTGGTPPAIRSMDVQDGYLYLGGRFTHLTGSGVTSEVYQRNIGRLSATTLAPVPGWNPMLDGTVVSVDASAHGDRVYAAGYFGLSRWTEATERAGAFTADDATVIPWHVDFSNRDNGRTGYQQAVREVGDRVWLGGSEHMLFSYNRSTMQEMSTNIAQNGGDFQAISPYGDDGLAAGCHCSENIYQGARRWPDVGTFSRVEHIEQTGIWRASDGAFVPEFSPQVSLRSGYGTWAIEEASDGSLWVGGDYTYARLPNTQNRWTGAFVRFAPTDTTAPSTPRGLTASSASGVDQLSWEEVTGSTYEVLRNDRVVATTTAATTQLPATSGAQYFVRSVDRAGNRSATSHAVVPEEVDPGTLPTVVIPEGSDWAHYYETGAPAPTWKDTTFDDTAWTTSPAPLGWGSSSIATTLTAPGTKPLTAYFRRAFTLDDATRIAALTLTTRADDGIVLYVNGTEIGRSNMPTGAIHHGTYATAAPRTSDAIATPLTLTAPGSLLLTGENVITAEVHLNYRSTPTLSYDLQAELVPGVQTGARTQALAPVDAAAEGADPAEEPAGQEAPDEPPAADPGDDVEPTSDPQPAGAAAEEPGVSRPEVPGPEVSGPEVSEPEVSAPGVSGPVADAPEAEDATPEPPPSAGVSDQESDSVCASTAPEPVDGKRADPGAVPEDPDEVITPGSDWALDCSPSATEVSGADWTSPGFDDSTWPHGTAPLGAGDPENELGTGPVHGDPAPRAARYRHTFTITSLSGVDSLELTVPANATYMLRINGVDAGRVDPQDEQAEGVQVEDAPSTDPGADSSGVAGPQETVLIPVSLLVEGENTLSVEILPGATHAPDATFDARGTLAKDPQ